MAKKSMDEVKQLIDMGKEKGFLTYDEVNEHMPENIISSDQMDDWLSAFSAPCWSFHALMNGSVTVSA